MNTATASARKSKGEFKPLIKYPSGKTEVVEQNPDRFALTPDKKLRRGSGFYSRGSTYPTREEATAAAQSVIDDRRKEAEERLARHRDKGFPEEKLWRIKEEVAFWGGEGDIR